MVLRGGVVAVCFEGLLREHVLAGGPARQPQPPVERQHEGLGGLGDLIRCAGRAQERPFGAVTPLERRDPALRRGRRGLMRFLFLWEALLLFVLRVVAGACVGRWTGQTTAAAGGAAARGVFGLGDCFTRSGATRRGLMRFLVLWGALLPFVLRACCGGMCWPVDRPATHAAAGAAARGVLVFSLVCLVFVVRAYVAGACVGRWTGQPTAAAGGAAAPRPAAGQARELGFCGGAAIFF